MGTKGNRVATILTVLEAPKAGMQCSDEIFVQFEFLLENIRLS